MLINNIYVHLTHACNRYCKYCYFDAKDALDNELSTRELCTLCEEIASIAPQKVVATGGEPLLREDLFEIATYFRKIDPEKQTLLCLISNGTLIDEKKAVHIAQVFDEVRISIDGPKEINDKLRGNGSFDVALKAIYNLKCAGIFPSINITVTSVNVPYLSTWLSFLLKEGIATQFHLAHFRPIGRGAAQPDFACSSIDTRMAIADFWQRQFGIVSSPDSLKKGTLANCGSCGAGKYVNILPDGSVYPCHVLSTPTFLLGNIRQKKLTTIIEQSTLLKKLRDIDFKHFKSASDRLKQVINNTACLGEVYRDAPEDFLYVLSSQ